MIQETTLRMVVRAVDQATAPLDNVRKKLDEVNGGLEDVQSTAKKSLPEVSKEAGELGDEIDDLGESAKRTTGLLGPGMVQAVAAAGVALVALANYIKDVILEQERIRDLSDRLDLPYDQVKQYSEVWAEVAISLSDVARGFGELKGAQAEAFKQLGLSAGNLGELKRIGDLVSIGSGTRQEKIDVFRILFGQSYEDAAKDVDERMRKLLAATIEDGKFSPIFEQRGLSRELDVGQLLGRLRTPNEVKDLRADEAAAEDAIRDINAAVKRARDKAADQEQKDSLARGKATNEANERLWDEYAANVIGKQKDINAAIEAGNREVESSSSAAWRTINENITNELRRTIIPVNQFAEAFKNAAKDAVDFADFSFKRLVARIILSMASRELYAAIDRLADALGNALDGNGGGGFLGKAGRFIGGLFGGNAGGGNPTGWRIVGEEGPELAYFGNQSGRVVNARQLAFAGAGAGRGSTTVVNNYNTYSISGVETQQVVAYIEQTRRQDQKANVKMLERNGLGRMR